LKTATNFFWFNLFFFSIQKFDKRPLPFRSIHIYFTGLLSLLKRPGLQVVCSIERPTAWHCGSLQHLTRGLQPINLFLPAFPVPLHCGNLKFFYSSKELHSSLYNSDVKSYDNWINFFELIEKNASLIKYCIIPN
jgi:hypothetical protein